MAAVELIISILTLLLWIIIGLVVVAVLTACTPLRIRARVDNIDMSEDDANLNAIAWNAEASLWFGVIRLLASGSGKEARLHVHFVGIRFPTPIGGKGKRAVHSARRSLSVRQQRRRGAGRNQGRKHGISVAQVRRALPEALRLVPRLWRTLHFTGRGNITYGFPDPAVTGLSQAVLAIVPIPRELVLVPVYVEGTLAGWAEMTVRVYGIEALGVLIRTAFRPAIRQLWSPRLRSALQLHRAMKAR